MERKSYIQVGGVCLGRSSHTFQVGLNCNISRHVNDLSECSILWCYVITRYTITYFRVLDDGDVIGELMIPIDWDVLDGETEWFDLQDQVNFLNIFK